MTTTTKPRLSAPTAVTLMITRRCNLHCLHCGSSPEQFLREDLSTKELLGVIDELTRCKVFQITVTGGEPLVHPDFFVLVDAIMHSTMSWQLDTNATLVTKQIAERLSGLPRQPFVSVSLDGITTETYERIRSPGSFVNAIKGIVLLRAAGLTVRPFTVLSRINYRELPEIVNFVKSVGIRSLNVTPPAGCGRAGRHTQDMALKPTELREAVETSLRIEASNPGLFTGPWPQMLRFYRGLKEGTRVPEEGSDGYFKNCGAARSSLAIACDGTVVPCDMSYTYRAGNLRDQRLVEIWRDSPAFRHIREHRGIPLEQIRGCEECSCRRVCQGPCPAGGYALTGVWPAPEPSCPIRAMGELTENDTLIPATGKAL